MTTPSADPALQRAHERFRAWMIGDAFPVWSTSGRDEPGLGFREHMTLEGEPAQVAFKRMRVQARQLYVFSHAHVLGAQPALAPAHDAFAFMVRHGSREDGAWARVLGRHGGVLDPAVDLYDLAFVLFGLAWYARATGERRPLTLARQTVGFIRNAMAAPGGGFHDVVPLQPGHRQQNPHMHLLEAALALFEVTGDGAYAELAHELVELFHARLHDQRTGTLGEFFDDALVPAAGEPGDHVEPGHHYEWVWLLDQHARLLGGRPFEPAARLYDFAEAHGRGAGGPAILDAVGRDGTVRLASSRLWPQTEALKAHATMARRGRDTTARLTDGLTHLLDRHLSDAPRGMWREHFGADGRLVSDRIPASSFYHVFLAFAELELLLRPGDATGLRAPTTHATWHQPSQNVPDERIVG